MQKLGDKRIAVVGAGIAGLRCADILREHSHVEMFEIGDRNKPSRPLQMEGGVHYCQFVPDTEPTHEIEEIAFFSENRKTIWKGRLGYAYKIGGTEGIDANLRRQLERQVTIHYSTRITSLEELEEFDLIIGADGFRSNIAGMADMRTRSPILWGIGIGSTVKGDFEVGKMECTFHPEIAPGGYCYLIPITESKATLASACISGKVDARCVREKLRDLAETRGYAILDEWADFEKWYNFNSYQKRNVYIIGGAASLTDKCFGFGLKYSIESAKLCARAITENSDYNALLEPVLKELRFWDKIGTWFITATCRDFDRLMRLANISVIRNRAQKGKSIRGVFRWLRLV